MRPDVDVASWTQIFDKFTIKVERQLRISCVQRNVALSVGQGKGPIQRTKACIALHLRNGNSPLSQIKRLRVHRPTAIHRDVAVLCVFDDVTVYL